MALKEMDEITREEAIRRIREFGLYHAIGDLPHSTHTVEAFNMAISALSQPEIIHCAECKHFTGLNDDEFALCDRGFTGMYVDADGSGFCSWAERRTDE